MDTSTEIFYIFIEKVKLPEANLNLETSLHVLIAAYFVFNLTYPQDCSQTMELLQIIAGLHTSFGRSKKKNLQNKTKILNFYKLIK